MPELEPSSAAESTAVSTAAAETATTTTTAEPPRRPPRRPPPQPTPKPGPPSIYDILIGLSIVTMGTMIFWPISQLWASERTFTPSNFEAAAVPNSAAGGGFDSSAATCRLATGGHPLTCSPDEQLSCVIDHFETKIRDLEARIQHLSAPMIEKSNRPRNGITKAEKGKKTRRNTWTREDTVIVTGMGLVVIGFLKIIGLIIVNEYLGGISPRYSTRVTALSIVGINIGALWSLCGLGETIGVSGDVTWDSVVLLCLFCMDVGCIVGSVMAFGETAEYVTPSLSGRQIGAQK